MSRFDDDDAEMNDPRLRRRGGTGPRYADGRPRLHVAGSPDDLYGSDSQLDGLLRDLRDLGRLDAPTPSPALAVLLSKGLPNLRLRRTRRRRMALGALLAASMTMGLTGIAAANDSLPGVSQNVVAGVINGLTPFHIDERGVRPGVPPAPPQQGPPKPAPAHPAHPVPSDSGTEPSESPEPSESEGGQPSGSAQTEPGDPRVAPSDTSWGPRESESESGWHHPRPSSTSSTSSGEHDDH